MCDGENLIKSIDHICVGSGFAIYVGGSIMKFPTAPTNQMPRGVDGKWHAFIASSPVHVLLPSHDHHTRMVHVRATEQDNRVSFHKPFVSLLVPHP